MFRGTPVSPAEVWQDVGPSIEAIHEVHTLKSKQWLRPWPRCLAWFGAAPPFLLLALLGSAAVAQSTEAPPLQPLPSLHVSSYMGTWYQVAWFPNRFQKHCVSDTLARYRLREEGTVSVTNACRLEDGRWDKAKGTAKPVGVLTDDRLSPAQLQVSFLPKVLRWLPVGWGDYWVIQRAEDGRYVVVSEPKREYLWVLARSPFLSTEDATQIREQLKLQGFQDLSRWRVHPHTSDAVPPAVER